MSLASSVLRSNWNLTCWQVKVKLAAAKSVLQRVQLTQPGETTPATKAMQSRLGQRPSRVVHSAKHLSQAFGSSSSPPPLEQLDGTRTTKHNVEATAPSGSLRVAINEAVKGADLMAEGELDVQELCVVCMERAPEVAFSPCRHAIACSACAAKIRQRTNECPMCRCPILAQVSPM